MQKITMPSTTGLDILCRLSFIILQSLDQNRLLKQTEARQKKSLPPPKEFVMRVIESKTSLELEHKHHPPRAHN